MDKYEIKDWIRLGIVMVIGAWIGWAITNYTLDVIKRNCNVNGVVGTNMVETVETVETCWTTNGTNYVLGLRGDGIVVWKLK